MMDEGQNSQTFSDFWLIQFFFLRLRYSEHLMLYFEEREGGQTGETQRVEFISCSEDLSFEKSLNDIFLNQFGISGLLDTSCVKPFYVSVVVSLF